MIELIETEASRWFADRDFQCPKCGSGHFGTSNAHIWEAAIGHCHGVGCNYSWPRLEDEQHFVLKEEI